MPRVRSWSDEELIAAVANSFSYRAVIKALGLIPAGSTYAVVQYKVSQLKLDISHFKGSRWNKGMKYHTNSRPQIEELLVAGSRVQSFKLKNRLYECGLKQPQCELCGWAQMSQDGRIPLELDHINGDHYDNRIENLRILCPNCHSLQLTHRGRNKKIVLAKLRV